MPVRHKVREHVRQGFGVRDYIRGSGEKTRRFYDEYRERKTREGQIRSDARSISEAEANRDRDERRAAQIRDQERIRAEQGGFFSRTAKEALAYGRSRLAKSTQKKRSSPRRRSKTPERRIERIYVYKSKPRKSPKTRTVYAKPKPKKSRPRSSAGNMFYG